ncbi:hypothetical protein V5799_031095, partial [Amblyomma americanum]
LGDKANTTSTMKITLVFLVSFLLGICYSDNFDHRKWCSQLSKEEILKGAARFPKHDCLKDYCDNGTDPYPRTMMCGSLGAPKCLVRYHGQPKHFPYCCSEDKIRNCTTEEAEKQREEDAERERQHNAAKQNSN